MRNALTTLLLLVVALAGCRSPNSYRQEADEVATDIIAEYQQKALGRTEAFSIERPSDALRRRLMEGQGLPGEIQAFATNAVMPELPEQLELTLPQALQVGARNSREYQARKEEVFLSALALDLGRDEFRGSYSGLITAIFRGDESEGGAQTVSGGIAGAVTRRLKSGASLSSRLALDLSKLLTGDRASTLGLIADASVSIPLLGGAGRDINAESLTQAERNLVYAMWEFERYRQSFSVDLFQQYFSVLEQFERIRTAKENYNSVSAARERAAKLAEAGRLPETQVDQAHQDELAARNRIIDAEQSYENQLDAFKIALGLPPDARLLLDATELDKQALSVRNDLTPGQENPTNRVSLMSEREAIEVAMSNRLDLLVVKGGLVDATRQVNIARDALRATADLTVSGSTREQAVSGSSEDVADIHFNEGNYSVGMNLGLPWERTAQRNAFRAAIIRKDAALRALESREDSIKQQIRALLRRVEQMREVYRIQSEAVRLAERRVRSTEMFLGAGRSEIRDLLEAQRSLIEARDRMTSTQISYRLARLNLQRDMGILKINEKGIWSERD